MVNSVIFVTISTALISICACASLERNVHIRQVRSPAPYPKRSYVPAPPGQTPDCAKNGVTFCENIDNYPGEHIYNLLKNSKLDIRRFLVSDTEDDVPPQIKFASIQGSLPNFEDPKQRHTEYHPFYLDEFEEPEQYLEDFEDFQKLINAENPSAKYRPKRQAFFESDTNVFENDLSHASDDVEDREEEEYLCPTVTAYVMPKAAMNVDKEWRYVVNIPQFDDMIQMIHMQDCRPSVKDKPCPKACDNRQFASMCTTDFLGKSLLSLDEYGEDVILETFMIPVGCSCQEEII